MLTPGLRTADCIGLHKVGPLTLKTDRATRSFLKIYRRHGAYRHEKKISPTGHRPWGRTDSLGLGTNCGICRPPMLGFRPLLICHLSITAPPPILFFAIGKPLPKMGTYNVKIVPETLEVCLCFACNKDCIIPFTHLAHNVHSVLFEQS